MKSRGKKSAKTYTNISGQLLTFSLREHGDFILLPGESKPLPECDYVTSLVNQQLLKID